MGANKHKSRITIITVVYNACSTLEATIRSVLDQHRDLFEYLIIDGGSTDGSKDIISKYQDRLSGWVSEPDNGIYDAMNKGINSANGEWIYFLGADDVLLPEVINQISPYLDKKYSIVFGDVIFDNGYTMRSFLNKRTVLQNTLHHQGAFYHISLFDNFRYDTNLRIVSDYELNLKIYLLKFPVLYIPLTIAKCATGGASSELTLSLKETNIVRGKYLKNAWKNVFFSVLLSLYYSQKRVRYLLYGHKI